MSSQTTWVPKPYKNYKWIIQDPELLGGHFAIRGTRLPVSLILECLSGNWTVEEIEEQYEGFPRESLSEIYALAAELTSLPKAHEPNAA